MRITTAIIALGGMVLHLLQGPDVQIVGAPHVVIGSTQGEETFSFPIDYAVGGGDTLYVLDLKGQRVRAFDRYQGFLFDLGRRGQGPGEFDAPFGIHYADGTVYVVDRTLSRLSVFQSDGKFLRAVKLPRQPVDVTSSEDNLYVACASTTDIVYRIPLSEPYNIESVLSYSQAELRRVPAALRRTDPSIAVVTGSLVVALPDPAMVVVLQIDGQPATRLPIRTIKPEHPLIEAYYQNIARLAERTEQLGIRVGIQPYRFVSHWDNQHVLLELSRWDEVPRLTDTGKREHPATGIVIDIQSGMVVGNPIVCGDERSWKLRRIDANEFAWVSIDSATVCIGKFAGSRQP